ncbi:MAG: flagellar biosynthesis protein FlhB [Gemmatimonadota bacterium]|nr:flagellar biosynthesis protein FlhB [Gemmatimonadota bacterium]
MAEDTSNSGSGSSDEEKTEEPTQKKLHDARLEGNVPRSTELSSTMILLTGVLGLFFFGSSMWSRMETAAYFFFNNAVDLEIAKENIQEYTQVAVFFLLQLTLPLFLMLAVVGMLTGVVQSGANITHKPLLPKASKMNPLKGLKRVFASSRALVELVKSVLKVLAVSALSAWTIKGMFANYLLLFDQEVGQFFIYLMKQIFILSIRIALFLLFLAVLDYLWQRYQHVKNLRMSRQEIKEERKQQEGDPMVKSRIRSIQMEAARKRMMQDVKEADVVVTNPTALAVALKYDQQKMRAPLVVAKGARLVAEKIKEIARANDIPVVENKPLAQVLYKTVEVGGEIPSHLYKAVAEVLAYVYRLKNKRVVA